MSKTDATVSTSASVYAPVPIFLHDRRSRSRCKHGEKFQRYSTLNGTSAARACACECAQCAQNSAIRPRRELRAEITRESCISEPHGCECWFFLFLFLFYCYAAAYSADSAPLGSLGGRENCVPADTSHGPMARFYSTVDFISRKVRRIARVPRRRLINFDRFLTFASVILSRALPARYRIVRRKYATGSFFFYHCYDSI